MIRSQLRSRRRSCGSLACMAEGSAWHLLRLLCFDISMESTQACMHQLSGFPSSNQPVSGSYMSLLLEQRGDFALCPNNRMHG